MELFDVVVVGAGPGGLAAATAAKQNGAEKVIVLDRNDFSGGVLRQCIHDGFGIIRYNAALTGPEYAQRASEEAVSAGVEIATGHMVLSIDDDKTVTAVCREGLRKIRSKSIVLATGCRERTRGAISIPGTRPAGVFTAGVVQDLVNVKNIMVGKRVVILGSGDIGLIMARRLTLEGAKVLAVIEIMKEPCGLQRNISQCLYDFDIPIYVSHTVSNIIGRRKLTAVEISAVDDNKRPIPGTQRLIECDSLVLSVGLIPENEVALTAHIELDGKSNGVLTDNCLQTSRKGIFACGNCRKVMDLADLVSKQGAIAGKNAARYLRNEQLEEFVYVPSGALKKGFPEEGVVICPLCPNGCSIRRDDSGQVTGNRCRRGAVHYEQEMIDPRRTLTTTVKGEDGKLHPVRIDGVRKADLRKTVIELNKRDQ